MAGRVERAELWDNDRMDANPFLCTDCERMTATADSGYVAVAVRYCPVHRAESIARMEHARATNPAIAAVHRMAGITPPE